MSAYRAVPYSTVTTGRTSFIHGADNMEWLRDTHLPSLDAKYKSALIFGNEDSPDMIQVYEEEEPKIYDKPLIFERT